MRWVCDGTDRLDWGDIKTIIRQSPRTSALSRHINGDMAEWDATDYLLAELIDVASVITWQLGGDGNAPRPKPYPRPGGKHTGEDKPEKAADTTPTGDPFNPEESGCFVGVATPLDELNAWLGWDEPEPSRDERILDFHNTGEMTYREIADRVGCSASTVGRVVRAARKK